MRATRQILYIAPILALVFALSGLLGSVRIAAAQGSSNDATVQAFIDAYNNGDLAKLQGLADPNFTFVQLNGGPGPQTQNLAEFFAPPRVHATPSNFRDVDANTVMLDITLTGGGLPPLPHPFMATNTFTFSNGHILKMTQMLSPQTLQDLAALGPPPGMPTTGQADQTFLIAALVLGLLSVGAGVRLRAAKAHRA
jgi:hypothetical protein